MKKYDPTSPLYSTKKTKPLWFRVTVSLLIIPIFMALIGLGHGEGYFSIYTILAAGSVAIILFAGGDFTVRRIANQQLTSPLSRKQLLFVFIGFSIVLLLFTSFYINVSHVFFNKNMMLIGLIGVVFCAFIAWLLWSIAWIYKVYFSSKRLPYPEYIVDHG